jgi:TatA/E family protein of Tat protein translocase
MGLHLPELIVLVGIALAIFGPKTLNSMARNAGKGVSQVKDAKDKSWPNCRWKRSPG